MPRNSQGLYTLPAGNPVVPNTLIESNWANSTMDDIAVALTASLPRDGSAPMTGPLTLSADAPTAPRHAVSKSYVEQFLAYSTGMPVGAISAYGGASAPGGWLKCDGAAVSRTTYADLFAAIGTIYGAGDASTTFNVPDLRDEFIRGKSAARALGSKQAASFASHTHTANDPGHFHTLNDPGHTHTAFQDAHGHVLHDPGHTHSQTVSGTPGSGFGYGSGNLANASTGVSGTNISIDNAQPSVTVGATTTGAAIGATVTGIAIGGTGGAETVPQNIALDYYIKAINDSTSGGGGGGTGTLTGVTSSDTNMIAIDNTDPAVPLLDIQANVAFGIPQLDVNGQVPLAQMPASLSIRESVTVATTYYVRTDGNDANDGKTNSALGAFKTIQKAVDVVSSTLDIASDVTVTIKVADGTYSETVFCKSFVGGGAIEIVGNVTTPSSCVVSSSSIACFVASSVTYSIKGFKLTSGGTSTNLVWAISNGTLILSNINFGSCTANQIIASSGGMIDMITDYTISGGAISHCYAISGGRIQTNQKTVTLSGSISFTRAYVWMDRGLGSVDCYGMTFSGTATGKRYEIALNSVCFVNGAAATYLPGSIAGTTATGAQYA